MLNISTRLILSLISNPIQFSLPPPSVPPVSSSLYNIVKCRYYGAVEMWQCSVTLTSPISLAIGGYGYGASMVTWTQGIVANAVDTLHALSRNVAVSCSTITGGWRG